MIEGTPEFLVYAFEEILSEAFSTVLNGADLTALSINDPDEFQKVRPRCEINVMVTGSGEEMYAETNQQISPGSLRQKTFTASAKIDVLTLNDQTLHAQYRATIRNKCAVFLRTVNPILERHALSWFRAGECEYFINPQEGYLRTSMNFDFGFCILNTAFADL